MGDTIKCVCPELTLSADKNLQWILWTGRKTAGPACSKSFAHQTESRFPKPKFSSEDCNQFTTANAWLFWLPSISKLRTIKYLIIYIGKINQFSTQELLWLIFGFLKIHKTRKTRHGNYMDFLWILTHTLWNPQNNHIWSAIFHATYGNFTNHVSVLNFPSMDCVY